MLERVSTIQHANPHNIAIASLIVVGGLAKEAGARHLTDADAYSLMIIHLKRMRAFMLGSGCDALAETIDDNELFIPTSKSRTNIDARLGALGKVD